MNRETPLPEVIKFIPPAVAEVLMYQSPELQTWVVTMLREIMVQWEETGVVLDPITMEGVLQPVMTTLMGCASSMIDMAGREG